jgi:hypothetical protein
MFRLLSIAGLLLFSPAVGADRPLAAGPTPKWVVFYADNYCVLIRPRSGLAGGLRIESRPHEAYHDLQFLLPRDGRGSYMKTGHLSVADSRRSSPTYLSVFELRSSADRRVTTGISNDQLAQTVIDKSLGVTIPDSIDEPVAVAGLEKALAALKKCEEGLAAHWGAPKTWSVDPVPNVDPQMVFHAEDYSVGLVSGGKQGDVRLLIKIGASGDALDCRSINPVEWKEFAKAVCTIIRKRVKFTPAKNAQGQAVESYYVPPRVRFQFMD